MPDVLVVGSLMLQTSYILYIVSLLPAWLVIRFKLKQAGLLDTDSPHPVPSGKWADMLLNAVILWVIVWKFGGLVFYPSMLWNNPWGILHLVGSWRESLLATAISLTYLYWVTRKHGLAARYMLDLLPYGIVVVVAIRFLFLPEYGRPTNLFWGIHYVSSELRYHPVHVYYAVLSLVVLLWIWNKKIGTCQVFRDFLLLYGCGLFLISFVKVGGSEWFGFGIMQFGSLCMIAVGLYILMHKKGDDPSGEKS